MYIHFNTYPGFVQLVPKTHAVAHVLSTYKTIQVSKVE